MIEEILCKRCTKNVVANDDCGHRYVNCSKNNKANPCATKCTHFEEKLKSNSKHFKEAKQTANKGKKPRKQPKKKEGYPNCKVSA